MALKFNGMEIESVIFKKDDVETSMNIIENQDGIIWCKRFDISYYQNSLITTVIFNRTATFEPSVTTGVFTDGVSFYHDTITVTPTARLGYSVDTYTSSYYIEDDITITFTTTFNGITINVPQVSIDSDHAFNANEFNENAFGTTMYYKVYNRGGTVLIDSNITIDANNYGYITPIALPEINGEYAAKIECYLEYDSFETATETKIIGNYEVTNIYNPIVSATYDHSTPDYSVFNIEIKNTNDIAVSNEYWIYDNENILKSHNTNRISANATFTRTYNSENQSPYFKVKSTFNNSYTDEWTNIPVVATETEMLAYLKNTGDDIALTRSGDNWLLSFTAFPEEYALYVNDNYHKLYTHVLRHRPQSTSCGGRHNNPRTGGSTTIYDTVYPFEKNKGFSRPENLGGQYDNPYSGMGAVTTVFRHYPTYDELKAGSITLSNVGGYLDDMILFKTHLKPPEASGVYQLAAVEMGVLHASSMEGQSPYDNSDNGNRMLSNIIQNQT